MRIDRIILWAGILCWFAGGVTGFAYLLSVDPSVDHNILYYSTVGLIISFISLGTSLIAVSISLKSDLILKALTNLNFFEKMAMLESYKAEYASASTRGTDANKKNLERCNYDICAISALDPFLIDDKKKTDRSCSARQVVAHARQSFQGADYEDILCKMEENAKKLANDEN